MGSRARGGGGFTLIELMIAVVIVGILAAVAYPSYVDYVRRAKRTDAQSALTGLAQAMERHFVQNNSYAGSADGAGKPLIYSAFVPTDVTTAARAYYDLTITLPAAAPVNTYTLNAKPRGSMAGDKCGTFTLTSRGQQGVSDATGMTAAECWRN